MAIILQGTWVKKFRLKLYMMFKRKSQLLVLIWQSGLRNSVFKLTVMWFSQPKQVGNIVSILQSKKLKSRGVSLELEYSNCSVNVLKCLAHLQDHWVYKAGVSGLIFCTLGPLWSEDEVKGNEYRDRTREGCLMSQKVWGSRSENSVAIELLESPWTISRLFVDLQPYKGVWPMWQFASIINA